MCTKGQRRTWNNCSNKHDKETDVNMLYGSRTRLKQLSQKALGIGKCANVTVRYTRTGVEVLAEYLMVTMTDVEQN